MGQVLLLVVLKVHFCRYSIYIYIIYHLVMNEKTGKLFVLTCLAMGKNGKIQLLRSCARFSRLVFFAVFL